jgi:hypothetical protein
MGLEVIHDPLTLLGRQVDDQAVTSFIAAFSGTLTAEPPDPDLPGRRYFVGRRRRSNSSRTTDIDYRLSSCTSIGTRDIVSIGARFPADYMLP